MSNLPAGRVLLMRYTLFAVLATLVNLGSQRTVLMLGDSAALYALAIATGTILGLVMKYALDKRWIFGDAETGLRAHGRKFTLYTAMGGFSTAIFWGTETAFWLAAGTHAAREVGGVLGLAMGYVIKYRLDKRFVFASPEAV